MYEWKLCRLQDPQLADRFRRKIRISNNYPTPKSHTEYIRLAVVLAYEMSRF
jgi:hypothetical protein